MKRIIIRSYQRHRSGAEQNASHVLCLDGLTRTDDAKRAISRGEVFTAARELTCHNHAKQHHYARTGTCYKNAVDDNIILQLGLEATKRTRHFERARGVRRQRWDRNGILHETTHHGDAEYHEKRAPRPPQNDGSHIVSAVLGASSRSTDLGGTYPSSVVTTSTRG